MEIVRSSRSRDTSSVPTEVLKTCLIRPTSATVPLASSSAELRGANLFPLGVWRSLVARSVRVGEVPSSNLGTPIESRGNRRFPREELQDRVGACFRALADQEM